MSGTKGKQKKAQIKQSGQGGPPGGGDNEPKQETARQQRPGSSNEQRRNGNSCERNSKCKGWKIRGDPEHTGKRLAHGRCPIKSSYWCYCSKTLSSLRLAFFFWKIGYSAGSRDAWVPSANMNAFKVTLAPLLFLPFCRRGN